MKIQRKITFLFLGVILVAILLFSGYQYTRYIENNIYKNAKKLSNENVIHKVLEFKAENYLQSMKDNGSWDEMFEFTKNKQRSWAELNFSTVRKSYNITNLTAYDVDGVSLYNETDSNKQGVILTPGEIKHLFHSTQVVHCFFNTGNDLYEIFGATIVPAADPGRKTKASGYLVCTRIWDDQYISELEKATGFSLVIKPVTSTIGTEKTKNDTIFQSVTGINNETVAQLAFFQKDNFTEELKTLQYFVISGLFVLILIMVIISFLTRKWLTIPLKKIISSLSEERLDNINVLIKEKNEFGQIAKLIKLYNEQKIELVNEINERKEATLSLQEAHQFSEMVYKVIPSALFTIDTNKRITSWNRKAEMITGFSSEEMMGKDIEMFTKVPIESSSEQGNQNAPPIVINCEDTILHKSGNRISILKNADILKDANGKVIGEIVSFNDISKSKQTEQKLRESQMRYSTLVNKMPNMILIHSKGKILFINDASVKIVGYSHEEMIGSDILKYLTKESVSIVQDVMIRRSRGERDIKDYEIQVITKSGEIRDVIIKTELITFDNEEAVLSILIDITERKRFEKILIDREIKLNTITRSAHDAIIMIDNEGLVSFWNLAAEKTFGYTEEEMLGKSLHPIIAPERYHLAHTLAFNEFRKTGTGKAIGETIELSALRKDGKEIEVELSLSAIMLNERWVAVGIVRDISERKLNEEALQKAKEDAENANKAKSEFLAMMSHEIRTPMNAIIGMTELTLTTKLSQIQHEYLEAVQNSAYSLLDTINDILDFSKIEAGKLEIENTVFNLREMVEQSVEIINIRAIAKNIELLLEIDPSLADLFIGDSLRLRQILINLIGNAIKFTEKGEICVSVKMNRQAPVIMGKIPVRFSVRDTGIGIPEEHLLKIFKSFEQADQSTTRRYGGTGLGLAISKRLTEMMGGKIWVESKSGEGSTFSFEVPMEVSDQQTSAGSHTPIAIKNVLVIDDNETNLKIMHDMLQYWGISSTTSSNGPEALEILKQSKEKKIKYDLVILDMHMPDMDGLMVADKIKNELQSEIKPMILMFSSIEKEHLQQTGKNAGIDKFLTKPVKMNELHNLLSNIFNKVEIKEKKIELETQTQEGEYLGKTILVAEDNVLNLKLINALLDKTGATILNAHDGSEAVKIFLNSSIDLIFMDVHMPVADGFEATRMIRAIEGDARHVPIVALTAVAMKGDRERCLECGMDDYLSKPFKNIDLKNILKKYLSSIKPVAAPIAKEGLLKGDEETIFDKNALMELTGNDEGLFHELLQHFKELFPGLFEKLLKAIAEADYKQIAFSSHTLKGMSGNLHANRIHQIAKQIEAMASENRNIPEIQNASEQLNKEFELFLMKIKDLEN